VFLYTTLIAALLAQLRAANAKYAPHYTVAGYAAVE
jgi:hypothetical protein